MIFAAGLGTRLRPLTDNMPKALVSVAGKTMLERVILKLKDAGFHDITINIHHLGSQIIDFLRANQNFGVDIHISDERGELLDTGGGIKKARPLLESNEPFLIHNADILTDLDLNAFYHHHLESDADATLLTNHRKTSRYLLMDQDNRLCGWTNISTGEVLPKELDYPSDHYQLQAFGCVHVLSPSIFRYMEDERWTGKFSIIPFYVDICPKARIQGFPIDSENWFDVGKPETLANAEAYYASL